MNIWTCLKCGKCCSSFVRTGPEVLLIEKKFILDSLHDSKIKAHIKNNHLKLVDIRRQINTGYLPLIGNEPPKKCIFRSKSNLCMIHKIKPEICKIFPVEVISPTSIIIDSECPRAEKIMKELKNHKYPRYIRDKINTKKSITIEGVHFFDRKMSERN